MRRVLTMVGLGLAAAGVLAALGALALPWASYRLLARRLPPGLEREGTLSIFDAPRGKWFLVVLAVLAVLVALAGLARGRARQIGGLAAPVAGLIAAVLVVSAVPSVSAAHVAAALNLDRVSAAVTSGAGAWFAVAAAAFLCFAGGLLSLGRWDR